MGSSADPVDLENLTTQLEEIRMLEAMFPSTNEIVWDDPSMLIDMEEYIDSAGKTCQLRFLSFSLNLSISLSDCNHKIPLSLSIIVPTSYPDVYPTISIMSNDFPRKSQSKINQDLLEYMSTLAHGEIILLNIITWIQENASGYCNVTPKEVDGQPGCENETTIGELYMWLYMHHIYNKEKRKNIINWAEELSLTGFSLPGKPGVVYIEGDSRNVEEYYERLRRLTWKRMSCKVKEKCNDRVFSTFQELCFDVHGARDYHMDLGKFFLFLKENGIGHMFKELFGVEGHE